MENQELNFKLTVDEANIILNTLNELPIYKMIGSTINKIQTQAQEQLNVQSSTPVDVEPTVE